MANLPPLCPSRVTTINAHVRVVRRCCCLQLFTVLSLIGPGFGIWIQCHDETLYDNDQYGKVFFLLRQNQQQDKVLSGSQRLFHRRVGWKLDKLYHYSIFVTSILQNILGNLWCMKMLSVSMFYFSVGFWVGSGPPPCPKTKRNIAKGTTDPGVDCFDQ